MPNGSWHNEEFPMIEVRNLSKHYGLHKAVDNLSFDAQPGEIVGILGPNGAGKTTTMRMLTGFMPPTSGSARIAGFDIFEDSLEVRRRVGYLPERVPVYPDMTVKGYLIFWAELRGVKKAGTRVSEILEQVQLSDRRNSLIRSLSKGMRQRLGLAQALVHNPEVIILDEPTIGIDPQQVIEVREAVRSLRENRTVLFSTHILSEAEQVCDRVIILNRGTIIAMGAPATLRDQLQPGAHLFLQVAQSPDPQLINLIERISGIENVTPEANGLHIRVQPKLDLRYEIARQVMAAGYALVELRPVAMTLEDIFLDILGRTPPHA